MGAEINYKNKYMELRSKYMNDLDMAFRLGFEQGGQQAQQDQMAQEQQQAQEIQTAAAGGQSQGGFGGAEGGSGPQEAGQDSATQENPAGTELDQHISKLESMIQKAESNPEELKKGIIELRQLQKSWKEQSDLKKSTEAISGIAKALHKPKFKFSKQSSINLNSNAKQAASLQHKIVNDVMQKMEAEEARASQDIKSILANIAKG